MSREKYQCCGFLRPVNAPNDWIDPVGIKGGCLYRTNDSQILPTVHTSDNHKVLGVISANWGVLLTPYTRTVAIENAVLAVKSSIVSLQNKATQIGGLI